MPGNVLVHQHRIARQAGTLDLGEVLGLVIAALGVAAAIGVPVWIARQANARQANATATRIADMQAEQRRSALRPQLRVTVRPWGPGSDLLRLDVMLTGPPDLDRLDSLTVKIRNDDHLRGVGRMQTASGPSQQQVQQHVWGPYRFRPGVGPDDHGADCTGREVVYRDRLPLGEALPYVLEPSVPAHWMNMSPTDWQRERGALIRLAFTAEHADHGSWQLVCEIDTTQLPATVYAPQTTEPPTQP